MGIKLAALAGLLTLGAAAIPDETLAYDLDPSEEHNAFSWATTVATFSAAYASMLLALAVPAQRLRFAALAGCFAFLSLDDAVLVHERLGAKVFDDWLGLPETASEQLEVLLYAPLFVAALWIVWILIRQTSGRTSSVLLGGISLLGLAVACELGGAATRRLDNRGVPLVDAVRIGIEEAAELSGWILVSSALTALACSALSTGQGLFRPPATGSRTPWRS